jgi:Protein of unknown function (DUF1524)
VTAKRGDRVAPHQQVGVVMIVKVLVVAAVVAFLTGAPAVHADTPDPLTGIAVAPLHHRSDYRRAFFGEPWTDDNDGPLGHQGCDTRDDILNRDLTDKTYVSVKRCPDAVAAGTLYDPYTGKTIAFQRGPQSSAAVQIDHLVPLALAWDEGAYNWTDEERVRFANDPAELLAVDGQANQDKGDSPPGRWMPPNKGFACQYAIKFVAVLREYSLPIDPGSVPVVQQATATCPTP